jgi:hypothetical protein
MFLAKQRGVSTRSQEPFIDAMPGELLSRRGLTQSARGRNALRDTGIGFPAAR